MFEKKKIRISTIDRFKKLKNFFLPQVKRNQLTFAIAINFVVIFALLLFGWGAYALFGKIKFSNLIPDFLTKEIKTDSENHTNILLVGIGGLQHDGGELTDTIIVASLDYNNNYTSLLSIPRDLYIKKPFYTRINNIYAFEKEKTGSDDQGMQALSRVVEDLLNIHIHYYALMDFKGFIKAVDILDGIDIHLSKSFYDPLYPKEGTIYYETFSLPAGENHLDGETALKFVRSRHSTSDFSRNQRQHQVLSLLKDKALSLQVLSSPSTIKKLINAFQDHFKTNLQLREILYLSKIASDFPNNKMQSLVINDNPASPGGFLYTPPQEEYSGAYVLLPYDSGEISDLSNFFLMRPDLYQSGIPIQILNTSGITNLAASVKIMLTRHGFNVIRFGNGKTTKNTATTIYFKGEKRPEIINTLLNHFPNALVTNQIPDYYLSPPYISESKIIIELGKNYLEYKKQHNMRFFY